MTEHKKISLKNAQPAKSGESLFERANGAFGLDGFAPAAPPKVLRDAPRPVRKKLKRDVVKAPEAAPKAQPVAAEPVNAAPVIEQPAPAPVAAQPTQAPAAAKTTPAPEPVREDVSFGGKKHAIDRDFLADQGMIVPDGGVTALLEEFRIVKRQLLSDARESGTAISRRMLVCSPHSGEGKTYCAVNLALALAAERDIEVLLVDADFPKPSRISRQLADA